MRFTLSTRHRRILVLTGDDIPALDENDDATPDGYVRLESADLSIAPEPEMRDDAYDDPGERFGFGR